MSGVAAAAIGAGGAIIGGMISSSGAKSAAKTQAAAQERAAQLAYEQSLPWDVSGLGGGITASEDDRSMQLGLSPELENIYSGMLSRSGTWAPMVQDLIADPFTAQQRFYEQQQAIFDPIQQRERLAAENRLLSMGLMGQGSAAYGGGNPLMQSVLNAQQESNRARQWESLTKAQGFIDTYLGRETSDLGTAIGLLDIPLQYANVSRGTQGNLSSAAQTGAALRSSGAQAIGAAQAGMMGGIGSGIANFGQNYYQNAQLQNILNQYKPSGYLGGSPVAGYGTTSYTSNNIPVENYMTYA